jgi:hypothetical protein
MDDNVKQLLHDLDDFLAHEEDTAHGEEGWLITELRGRINKLLYPK